jgi:peptidoglycan/xylan/chitin deacetylase (PgdA/CDA1 family)
MIGVMADQLDVAVIEEFFQLFKTAWEWYQPGKRYEVLLAAGECIVPALAAKRVVMYSAQPLALDAERGSIMSSTRQGRKLSYRGHSLPVYGDCLTFRDGEDLLQDESECCPAMYLHRVGDGSYARVGYDLFREIRTLLTEGQPAANAATPALDLHIAILRDLITSNGGALDEIPPVPDGYKFIACLTHDVDHAFMRKHGVDQTILGFVYRAVVGSVGRYLRGELRPGDVGRNWLAAAKLPLIQTGLAKDPWSAFPRYTKLEAGAPSTFFIIPFKNYPGRTKQGLAPRIRASAYGASDITAQASQLMSAGCEIGLHGIDAWISEDSGRIEFAQIRRLTGKRNLGVRMHWLYFDEKSVRALEAAGADYDSTSGYNDAIGYRNGTTQVYRPLGTTRLLELPLHIMDTALFYPGRMNLSPREATDHVQKVIANAVEFGGVVTLNWHDRSIAPERCWDAFYVDLVRTLKDRGAWFATAEQTVAWFRKRRAAAFEDARVQKFDVSGVEDYLPALQLRSSQVTHIPLHQYSA